MLRALPRMNSFETRGQGSFLAYLRQILKNRIRDELRRTRRHPEPDGLDEEPEVTDPSPVEEAIGSETWRRYERALASLPEQQQEGVIMRVELQLTHQQVAEALGLPSSDAARMMVRRALTRLAESMEPER